MSGRLVNRGAWTSVYMSHVMTKTIRCSITRVTLVMESSVDHGFALTRILVGPAARRGMKAFGERNPQMERHARLVARFLDGKERDLGGIELSYKGFSVFRKRVSEAARRIPWGKTVSYAELARMAGYPGAARAAASVMRNNPFPLVVPCHRVVRSDGAIGGFGGKMSGKNIELKRALLRREGVLF